MQQEQPKYFKVVKASKDNLPKEVGPFHCFDNGRMKVYTKGDIRTLMDISDIEYLEPIPLPDAAVLREALEKILAIKNGNIGTYLQKLIEIETIAREALSAGDGWVRCEEKNPELDKLIWLSWEDDKSVELGRYVSGERYMENDPVFEAETPRLGRYVEPPTHWKPYIVPSPPIK